jgi:uncharacterized protein YjbK
MEVEIKLRIDKENYIKIKGLFDSLQDAQLVSTDFQHNYFLDCINNELEKKLVNFRARRTISESSKGTTTTSIITMKGKSVSATLTDGISKVSEVEDTISNNFFDLIVNNPNSIRKYKDEYPLFKLFLDEISDQDIRITSDFKTIRSVYNWKGLIVEIDWTTYSFGDAFEIEVEHYEPEKIKIMLENLLKSNDIKFSYSKRSKFGNMKAGFII